VVIEMKDHIIVVEAPLNEERSVAVIAETRKLVPNKPIRYVINSHHHFDHAGGLRAFVAEGVTVITQDVNRAFLAQALGAPATVRPDAQAKSGRQPTVEGVSERRTFTDGTRTVEIYRIQGILHHDGMLMVYLPKEKLLSQADAYTPVPPNATPPTPPSPFSVALADNIARLKLDVVDLLPLHGRLVPVGERWEEIQDERSPGGLSGPFLEPLVARGVFGARHSLAAVVRRGRSADQHSILPYSGDCALAAGPLGARIHRDQSVSDHAHLSRATSRRALEGRAGAL
jgi:glyoxylase-like metal-dependent hydrolase (beta-lactamase superfamily II)